jgi:hypothetical protein
MKQKILSHGLAVLTATAVLIGAAGPLQAQDKKPNIVMLMTDDTGWNDFGCYSGGGAGLGHLISTRNEFGQTIRKVTH